MTDGWPLTRAGTGDKGWLPTRSGEAPAGAGSCWQVRGGVDKTRLARCLPLGAFAPMLGDVSAMLVHQLALRDGPTLVVTVRSGEPAPDAVTALWKDGLLPGLVSRLCRCREWWPVRLRRRCRC